MRFRPHRAFLASESGLAEVESLSQRQVAQNFRALCTKFPMPTAIRIEIFPVIVCLSWRLGFRLRKTRLVQEPPPARGDIPSGAHRRRRGGAASVQHSRQRLFRRIGRFHRRHGDHPRPLWTKPWRVCLPRRRRARRIVEAWPVEARRQIALRARRARPRSRCGAARGIVRSIAVKPGQTVRAGDLVLAIEEV